MVAVAAVCATMLVKPAPLPAKLLAVILPVNVLLGAPSWANFVVSTLRVTLPPSVTAPPPVRPVPAVTVSDGLASIVLVTPALGILMVPLLVMVPPAKPAPAVMLVTVPLPVPGKVCPEAKVMRPLPAIESPVSAGVLPAPNNRLNFPEGEVVLLPTGSACHRKSWSTAVLVPLLNDDTCVSRGLELNPAVAVAVPVAGNAAPAADTVLLKVAVVPVRPPVRLAEPPENEPVALMFPVTLWSPLKPLPWSRRA